LSLSDWLRVLREAGAADVLLVGVPLPMEGQSTVFVEAFRLIRRANQHLITGEYDTCIAECRRALESVWAFGDLESAALAAGDLLASKERKSMGRKHRILAVAEAVRHLSHLAHHVDDEGNAEVFGRLDAALVLATTSALVSALAPAVEVEANSAGK